MRLRDNNKILDEILFHITRELDEKSIPQPVLIIGQWGSGKTYLLNEIIDTIKSDRHVPVIQLDGTGLFSSEQIIDSADSHLKQTDDRRILVIDDMDFYLTKSHYDDQYKLRNYLNNENAPLLIGTSSSIPDAITDYKAPFFEGLKIIYIPPVNINELSDIPADKDTSDRIKHLLSYMPRVIRSVMIARDIVSVSRNREEDISKLLNIYSPFYRTQFESIPLNSQKIVSSLAEGQAPMNIGELSEKTQTESGILSTYLRQLNKSRIIKKTSNVKRGAKYELTDPLFKLWLSRN